MGVRRRAYTTSSVVAVGASAVMAWLGLYGFAWTDYENETAPAYLALVHGQVGQFLRLLPAYGGSLEIRAPFALLPGLWDGGQLAVYRLVAAPCLLAAAALGVWLVGRMRADGRSRLARGVVLGLCVANPLTLRALEIGHPEELLGAVLCVAATLAAARDRPVWAGLLLGSAIANKQWALLAVGPVLVALPGGRLLGRAQVKAMVAAGVVATALFLPIAAFHPAGGPSAGPIALTRTGVIFEPEQVFWFLGGPSRLVRYNGLLTRVHRTPPAWLTGLAHPLIIALAVPLTLLCLRRRRPETRLRDALLLLALVFLLRCALDPWDNVYYPLPFVLALLGWEATTRREPPVFSLAASFAVWGIFVWMQPRAPANLTAGVSIALFAAAATAIAHSLYGRSAARSDPRPAQSAITSSLVNRLRISAPSSVTTTRSSIRTPSRPGR